MTGEDARRTQRTPLKGAAAAVVVTALMVFALDGQLPPFDVSEASTLPWRGAGWLSERSLAVVASVAGVAFLVGALVLTGASRANGPTQRRRSAVLALLGLALLVAAIGGGWAAIPSAFTPQVWWTPRAPSGVVRQLLVSTSAGLAAAACIVGVVHPRLIRRQSASIVRGLRAIAWLSGAAGLVGAIYLIVNETRRFETPTTSLPEIRDWRVAAPALRLALAASVFSVILALFMPARGPDERASDDGASTDAPRWTRDDDALVHLVILLLTLAAAAGCVGYCTSVHWTSPTVSLFRTSRGVHWIEPLTILVVSVAAACVCARVVLTPTRLRLRGRGKLVSWVTTIALAIFIAVPGATMVMTHVDDDYRTVIPVQYQEPLWIASVVLIIVPATAAFIIAVRRAVAPHDPRRLTRFLAVGLGATLLVTGLVTVLRVDDSNAILSSGRALAIAVVPAFLAAMASTLWSHAWMARPLVRWHRRLCITCGYPRHVPAGDACPECGRPWTRRRANALALRRGEGANPSPVRRRAAGSTHEVPSTTDGR